MEYDVVKENEKIHSLLNSWLIEHSPDIRSKLFMSGNLLKLLKHVFWSQDQELMLLAKSWAEDKIWEVANRDWPSDRKEWSLKQFLCFFPYFLSLEDQKVKLPILNSDRWIQETFNVEHIPLMPKYFPKSDQFYAYGLKPENPDYKSMLLYKGTTYPADSGYWTTLMADLFPFTDIGAPILWFGREHVSAWAEKQITGIDVMGKSLGGALSLMSHDIKNVQTVTAANPALPSSSNQISSGTQRTIILNREDSISKIGVIPEDVIVKQAEIQGADKLPGGIAHAQPWLMNQDAILTELNDVQKTDRKYKTWVWIYWLVRPITFCVFLPFYLLHLMILYMRDAVVLLFKECIRFLQMSPLVLSSYGPSRESNSFDDHPDDELFVHHNSPKPSCSNIKPLIV